MNIYHILLDLPESETQPDYYALLGIPRFTDDRKLIHAALVKRNTQLKSWDNSKYFRESNRLLDEAVAAAGVLEDPVAKAAYDALLKQQLGSAGGQTTAREEGSSSVPAAPVRAPIRPDEETSSPEDGPETNFDSLFLKLSGGLIGVTLLIAVPVMWPRQKVAPVSTHNESVVTPSQQAPVKTDMPGPATLVQPVIPSTPAPLVDTGWNAGAIRELTKLSGHRGEVWSVAFRADGRRLASAGSDQTVKVWDTVTDQELFSLAGHADKVWCVSFSTDGKRLASASADKTVKVWDAMTGTELKTLRGHRDWVTSVAFGVDGRLATVSSDRSLMVWDAETGRAIRAWPAHPAHVECIAFSPDAKRLATASHDQTVKVWDADSGDELLNLKGHSREVKCVAFSPDGTQLASGGWDETVKLWDAESGLEKQTLKGHTGMIMGLSFSSDGKRLASAGYDQMVKVWNTETAQELVTLKGHSGFVSSVTFDPSGQRLASAGSDQSVRVWGGERISSADPKEPVNPKPVSDWVPGNVREFATLSGHLAEVKCAVFSPDGNRLASASADQTVKVWDIKSGMENLTLRGHTSWVMGVAFSPDGTTLATASLNSVKVWDAATGLGKMAFNGHTRDVWAVVFNRTGDRIATASYDQTVKIWDAVSGRILQTMSGHTREVTSVAFSPDGTRVASASGDNTVRVWDTATGREMLVLKGHSKTVNDVVYSADGTRLASGSWDRTIKVWNTADGQELKTLAGHDQTVMSVAFSPDGKLLASGSGDPIKTDKPGEVKVWDATSGQELVTLTGHQGCVESVAFNVDGSRLASASDDKTIKLWGPERSGIGKTAATETNPSPSSDVTATVSRPPRDLPQKASYKAEVDAAQEGIDFKKFIYQIQLNTSLGVITLDLRPDLAPGHCKNLIALADIGFYDGKLFHRVINDYVIQAGSPASDRNGGPGYAIKSEFSQTPHDVGVLSMARLPNDPNSAGSQFFICLNRTATLDGQYTVFGKVADPKSLAVVQAIGKVPTDSMDVPRTPVVIKTATVIAKAR